MKTLVLFSVFIILVISATLDSSYARYTKHKGCPEIDKTAVCSGQPKVDNCEEEEELEIRWFYVPEKETCVAFSGCSPGLDECCIIDNNFPSKEECLEFCDDVVIQPQKERNETDIICSLPPDKGHCFAFFHKWYYEPATKECEIFIYGGCEGNENNFESRVECEQTCGRGKGLLVVPL